MQFALSTHLFHGERLGRRHLETIAAHGFEIIELFATKTHFDYHDPREIDALGTALADLGMRAGSMHAPICAGLTNGEWGRPFSTASSHADLRNEAIAETAAAFAAAKTLGCDSMALHLGIPRPLPVPPGDNDAAAVRRSLEDLVGLADDSGVRLALEVIPNDLSTPDALVDWLSSDLNVDRTGICLDVGHAHLMGGVAEAIDTLSGHIIATHVHDNHGMLDEHLVPFSGGIDWTTALTAMWKVGYSGRLTFEVPDHGNAADVLSRIVRARTRLQAILDELTLPISFDDV